ncbi:MAG: hypothetical protein AB3N23_03035 [Paracoccaceae bacterium]
MRPYQHAKSSGGARWQHDLEIHEFIDSSKAVVPGIRHRLMLHSVDFGADLVALAFPNRNDAAEITRRHVREDLNEDRTLSDWLSHIEPSLLPRIDGSGMQGSLMEINWTGLVENQTHRIGLSDTRAVKAVLNLLLLPTQHAPDACEAALALMCNAFGVSLVRRILGPPKELDGAVFDPAQVAEYLTFSLYNRIPSLSEITGALRTTHQGISVKIPQDRAETLGTLQQQVEYRPPAWDAFEGPELNRFVGLLRDAVKRLLALQMDPVVVAASPNLFNDIYYSEWQAVRVGDWYSERHQYNRHKDLERDIQSAPAHAKQAYDVLQELEKAGWRDLYSRLLLRQAWGDQALSLVIQDGMPWLVFNSSNNSDENHVFALWYGDQPLCYFGEAEERFDGNLFSASGLRVRRMDGGVVKL